MNKIWLVIQREYLTRVRKKSFLIMSLLAPLLLAGASVLIAKINAHDGPDQVLVRDDSGLRIGTRLADTDELRFVPATEATLAETQAAYEKAKPRPAGLLVFPAGYVLDSATGPRLLAKGNVPLNRQSNIRKAINKAISEMRLSRSGLQQKTIDNLQARVELTAINLDEKGGKRNDVGATTLAAYGLSILVYFFIFIYGVQVMRSVSEEKSSRIMEVMISSIKPFQLMMGKIVGIAGVVLTQFGLWLVLTWAVTAVAVPLLVGKPDKNPATSATMATAAPARAAATGMSAAVEARSPTARPVSDGNQASAAQAPKESLWEALQQLPFWSIALGFLFFFFGGYLLYSALFAAIGSAVDDQTDAQQFMLPVTIPLILSYVVSINVIINGDPNGTLAFWLSMIPFTSPIAMVMRLPFGVPTWQLLLSASLLVLGFVGTTWVAARIYRVGILMYGKKITYRELSKWLFYKG